MYNRSILLNHSEGETEGSEKSLTVIDEGSRAQPQLSTALAGGVHHTEIIYTSSENRTIICTQLCNTSLQDLHTFTHQPAEDM